MEIVGLALLFTGGIINLYFSIKMIVLAFQTSILWGLATMFIPLAGLVFIVSYWEKAKEPFLGMLASIPFIVAAIVMMPPPQ
ncbi:hypothetical protein GC170_16680 [bacterium]|nr:hypothetical protein [bacterium]